MHCGNVIETIIIQQIDPSTENMLVKCTFFKDQIYRYLKKDSKVVLRNEENTLFYGYIV